MTERIEAIEVRLDPSKSIEIPQYKIELSHREQEVFLILYANPNKVTSDMLAKRLGLTTELVEVYLYNIIAKRIPILKQILDNQTYYYLDSKFREVQAKHNVVNIDEGIVKELFN